jgi:hypothetical protein
VLLNAEPLAEKKRPAPSMTRLQPAVALQAS